MPARNRSTFFFAYYAAVGIEMFLQMPLRHLISNVIRLTNSESNDREGRIGCRPGSELAAVRDKQVPDVVCLASFSANTVVRTLALSTSA
jgi:hypothetical protein